MKGKDKKHPEPSGPHAHHEPHPHHKERGDGEAGKSDGVGGERRSEDAAGAASSGAPVQAPAPATDDRLLRLQADFDNFRKRTLREKNELYQKAHEDIMLELLSVLDHVDLALKRLGPDVKADDPMAEGFRLVAEQMRTVMGKFGLTAMKSEGESFDPERHDAISHIPSGRVPENGIITETRRGYLLGGRILRPAQVVVSSGPEKVADDTSDGEACGDAMDGDPVSCEGSAS